MRDLFWLTKEQLALIDPFFPLTRGVPRVDDRRVVSGIIFIIKNGLRQRQNGCAVLDQSKVGGRFRMSAAVFAGGRAGDSPRMICGRN